jgi:hypothetical protein
MMISTDNTAIAPYNSAQPSPSIPTGGIIALAESSYTAGSYLVTWSGTYAVDEGNSSTIYKLITTDPYNEQSEGLIYLFNMPQQKTNLYTLTVVWQYTWGRIFV